MHAALLVDEIAALVAAHVLGPRPAACAPRDTRDTASVLALALTRRALLAPALDTLWRELASLRPVLALLPADGARLDLYARRVRHLTADDPAEVDALGAALLPPAAPAPSSGRFSTACPPSTLCPSSSSAPHPCARTCPNSGADGPPPPAPARPLLPRLRTLHATASSPRALQALARLAPPTLQLVDIHALFPPSDPCLGLGDSFRALRGLRTLAFDLPLAPAPAILGALGALPALRDLRLALAPLDPSCEPWVAPAGAFPELRTLALSGPHAAHTHCLRALPALPALESAALVLTPPGGAPAALEALLKARAPRLRDLDICDEEELDDSDMESEPDEDAPRDVLALVPGPGPAVVVF